MPDYRLYIIGKNGRFTRAVDLDCTDDVEAVKVALEHQKGFAMELWCGARIVRKFRAPDRPAP